MICAAIRRTGATLLTVRRDQVLIKKSQNSLRLKLDLH